MMKVLGASQKENRLRDVQLDSSRQEETLAVNAPGGEEEKWVR